MAMPRGAGPAQFAVPAQGLAPSRAPRNGSVRVPARRYPAGSETPTAASAIDNADLPLGTHAPLVRAPVRRVESPLRRPTSPDRQNRPTPSSGLGEPGGELLGRRPRVSLATWAGLETTPTASGAMAGVAQPLLDSVGPLLPPRLNAMAPPREGTWSQGKTSVGPGSATMEMYLQAMEQANLLVNGHPQAGASSSVPGADAWAQQLHEANAITPTPARTSLLASSQLASCSGAQSLTSPRELMPVAPPRPLLPPPTPTIALDVDEVLCRYINSFRKWLQQERPHGPLDNESVFREAHDPNSPWRLQFAMCGGLDNLEAVPGAAPALRRLRAAGLRLEVVTSRPPIMRESTEALLSKLYPPDTFSAAHFVGPGEKGRTCNAIRAVALVDDQIPNVVDASACGVIAVLFNFSGSYPWAACSPEDLPAGVLCLETWAATSDYLLAALQQSGKVGAPPGGDFHHSARGYRRSLPGDRRAFSPGPPEARRQFAGELRPRSPGPFETAGYSRGLLKSSRSSEDLATVPCVNDSPLYPRAAASGSAQLGRFEAPYNGGSISTSPARAQYQGLSASHGGTMEQPPPSQIEDRPPFSRQPFLDSGHGSLGDRTPFSRQSFPDSSHGFLTAGGLAPRTGPAFEVGTMGRDMDDTQASCVTS
uniref:Uncharacterized protein n=2 Tax=Alexandrium monilatum TaxID=311494 RepID=A0A7S4V8E4_9DINO